MSSFTSKLKVEQIGKYRWRVTEAFRYYIGEEDSGYWVDIPVGYETDLASIPQPFRWLLKNDDPMYAQAAVVHDWLCEKRGTWIQESWQVVAIPIQPNRRETDDIFLEAMGVLKCPPYKKYPMFLAVRTYAVVTGKV